MKSTVSLSVLLFFLLTVTAPAQASSCVQCHTSEAVMKSLYQAPAVAAGEEGEG